MYANCITIGNLTHSKKYTEDLLEIKQCGKQCIFSPSNIKQIRLDMMLSQGEFAMELDITFASVNRYKNSKSILTSKVKKINELVNNGGKNV